MPEGQPNVSDMEKGRLANLADELDVIQLQKTKGRGDIIMGKLIARLRSGDEYAAKVFLANEADKFSIFRTDAIPLIIDKLYGGSGSPWITIERKMKAQ